METDNPVHPAARQGFVAGEFYDRVRSEVPDVLAARLFRYLEARPGARVLDLGAGTGKFTARLLGAGFEVTALEPAKEMRAILETNLPRAVAVDGVAERLPFPSEYYDFVFAATAYHWFSPLAAYREIHRVLKPGGGLGLLWTTWHGTLPDWYKDLRKLTEPFEAGVSRYKHMKWREPFDREIDFKMLQFESHDISRPVTSAEICDRFTSVSYIAALPELVLMALRREMERVLETYIEKGESFRIPEEIHMYWTHKESVLE